MLFFLMSVYQIGTYPGFLPGIPSAIEHSGDHIASLTFPQLLKLFCPFQHLHRNKAPQMPYAVKEGCLAIGSGKHKSGVIHRPEGISGSVNTERPLVFMDPPLLSTLDDYHSKLPVYGRSLP